MANIFRMLHWACRVILAGIFLYSGYVKLQSPLQFAAAITGYKLVPDSLVFPLATYLPWLEIALGVLLLSGWKVRYVALGASALLLGFIAILTTTYLRGIDADCGCFGFGDKISPKTIARDMLILLPAIYLAVEFRLRKPATNPPE
ncbi:MAG TPA: MauE/DoxX family redox-associated membrane protein [Acidobacteriota bacterium]|nr:MauE/DoxX family redox-associated membrane protein [Acidobacteriota bacterium]